ncbi:MAG: right-handed parallel beta-helix repeat-containing protein, partial [Candidatus Kariarchaeaceae archaeon]
GKYIYSNPISINGNQDLSNQAAAEGWSGVGSEGNPFIIEGLEISDSGNLISISNTNLYFEIRNCHLRGEGEGAGIYLFDVSNSQITNNTIYDNTLMGIGLNSSQFVNITKNTIYNNGEDGIKLVSSENNIITDNVVHNNNFDGIYLLISSHSNIIRNNIVNNNLGIGLNLLESDNCTLTSNIVFNSSKHGVKLGNASHNVISSNTISNNQWAGLLLRPESDNNTVRWNNFVDNNASPGPFWRVQAQDNGSSNLFEFNYWNEWTNPDINGDGYVDDPKLINNSNQDNYSLVSIHNFITELVVLFPNGGESLYEIVTISWSNLTDSYDHETTYSIYYSIDNGLNWNIVVLGLNTTSYEWDTRIASSGSSCLLKVVATCAEGLIAEDTSDEIFSINNELTPPVLVYPNGGEIIKGIITIQWTPATDSMGHSIIYGLLYSVDNSSNWNWIISGLTMSSYNWDTTNITTGTTFLIKVIVTCSGGGTREDTSDEKFFVHYITTPTTFTLDRTLIGVVTIQWSASVDSLGQNVTYSVFYSSDRGSTWTLLASELTETSYDWNTTTVSDGHNYRIKVVASSEGLSTEIILPDIFTIDNIPPNFSFLIMGLAVIAIIPELYLGRKFSNFVNKRRLTEGVENV